MSDYNLISKNSQFYIKKITFLLINYVYENVDKQQYKLIAFFRIVNILKVLINLNVFSNVNYTSRNTELCLVIMITFNKFR